MAVLIFSFSCRKAARPRSTCRRAWFHLGLLRPSISRFAWPCVPCGCISAGRKRRRKSETTNKLIITNANMTDEPISIRPAELDDINTIGFLAQQIWPVAYDGIVPPDQLQYMLNLFYSPAALRRQMVDERHQFLVVEQGEEAIGFAAWSAMNEPGVYKLQKLYVLPGQQ